MSELAPDEPAVADFFAVLNQAFRDACEREAVYRAWLDRKLPALAEELTATLPADLRAAGMRFEWAEEQ